jgi:hypothetical protein
MLEQPHKWKGQLVRVVAQEKLPSGALRMPVFKDIRSEAWPRKNMKLIKDANLKLLKQKFMPPRIADNSLIRTQGDRVEAIYESPEDLAITRKQASVIKSPFSGTKTRQTMPIIPAPETPQVITAKSKLPEGINNMPLLEKSSGVNWGEIGKKYLLPSLAIGPVMGAAVTAATSKDSNEFKQNVGKGMLTGVAADALTGIGMGLWNQRKALKIP